MSFAQVAKDRAPIDAAGDFVARPPDAAAADQVGVEEHRGEVVKRAEPHRAGILSDSSRTIKDLFPSRSCGSEWGWRAGG